MSLPFLTINNISFPGLGLEFNVNPVALEIGGLRLYWYGIIIIAGILLSYLYAMREAKRTGLDGDTVSDVLLVSLPSAIVCARIYYVIFSWKDYAANPLDALKIWEGGIAIYGGVIGAVLATAIYCKVTKKSFLQIADVCMPAILIGQAIGRWGNFINCEAYGTQTNLPWRMQILEYGKFVSVHPTFLYESLWNFAGFAVLFFMRKHKPFRGFMMWAYLLWYGIGRFFVEGMRTDSLMLGNARVSQLVALLCVIVSVIVMIVKWNKDDDAGDEDNTESTENTEEMNSDTETETETETDASGSPDEDLPDGDVQ